MATIEISGFSFSYKGMKAPALDELNIQINPGDVLAVIGLNGSGKTTFCLALSGLLSQFYQSEIKGSITIFGQNILNTPIENLHTKISLLMQNPVNQLTRMRFTVFEEIAFGLENLGVDREEMTSRVMRVMTQMGLDDLKDRSPSTLSGGQQQKLALASILVLDAPILLMDEPVAMLDPQASQEFFSLLHNISLSGKIVILTENKLENIPPFINRVVALSEGKIILDGKPEDVLTAPVLFDAGVRPMIYTETALRGLKSNLWAADRRLPINLTDAKQGFQSGSNLPNT
jgi:energy-coupling factor transport system ATP-binding protein